MKIKSGDIVKVIAGNGNVRGTVGKVVFIDRKKQRVILENGPVHKKHLKPERSRKHPEGGIIEQAASIHISNVMLMSEAANRPVRTGFMVVDGKKVRATRGKSSFNERV